MEVVGFDELLMGGGIVVVEWAAKVAALLPGDRLDISDSIGGGGRGAVVFCFQRWGGDGGGTAAGCGARVGEALIKEWTT